MLVWHVAKWAWLSGFSSRENKISRPFFIDCINTHSKASNAHNADGCHGVFNGGMLNKGWSFHDRRGIELVFKSQDCCFTMRLFHSATIFFLLHMYLMFETSPGWLLGWRFFAGVGCGVVAYLDLVGDHSAPVYLLFGALYWSLGRRGYLDVSNVALVHSSVRDW